MMLPRVFIRIRYSHANWPGEWSYHGGLHFFREVYFACSLPLLTESRVWLEARQFVRKNCRPDRLCTSRLKARQFVIKITNHKKSFGNARLLERSQNSFYDFFTLKLAIFNCRCDKFSEIMCKKIINALNLYNPSEGLYKLLRDWI